VGKTDNNFDPLNNATRAEITTILSRLIDMAVNKAYNAQF
jgi:hypothetical protein